MFAGATVVIALVGLVVVNIPFLTVMGLAAAGAVVVAVLIATTLLPALLGFAGARVARFNRAVTWRPAGQVEPGDRRVCATPASSPVGRLSSRSFAWRACYGALPRPT